MKVGKTRSAVWIDFEARTANAGTIRGSDMLNTAWPPAVGDRIEILYVAVGRWRHAVVTANRNWLNPVFVPAVALGFGLLLGAAALVVRRERRAVTGPPA